MVKVDAPQKETAITVALCCAVFVAIWVERGLKQAAIGTGGFLFFCSVMSISAAALTAITVRRISLNRWERIALAYTAIYLLLAFALRLPALGFMTAIGAAIGMVIFVVTQLFSRAGQR